MFVLHLLLNILIGNQITSYVPNRVNGCENTTNYWNLNQYVKYPLFVKKISVSLETDKTKKY